MQVSGFIADFLHKACHNSYLLLQKKKFRYTEYIPYLRPVLFHHAQLMVRPWRAQRKMFIEVHGDGVEWVVSGDEVVVVEQLGVGRFHVYDEHFVPCVVVAIGNHLQRY